MAPMEGITGYVFRNAVNAHFNESADKYFTPFIEPHVKKKGMTNRERNDVLPEHNVGIDLVPQILTNSADAFLMCEQELKAFGYKELNINLGCPSPTVTTKGRGSGLLKEKARLDEMLAQIFDETECEISIKTRIGFDDPDEWADILDIYNKYPLKELIIHPRVRNEFYAGAVHTDAFIYALDHSRHLLCYNGDICSAEDYERLLDVISTGAYNGIMCTANDEKDANVDKRHRMPDAVMIGRGMVADPGLIKRLKSKKHETTECIYKSGKLISAEDIRAFTDDLLNGYIELMSGETPVLHKMKEIWTWLIVGFPDKDKCLKRIVKSKSVAEYRIAADEALKLLEEAQAMRHS